MTRKMPGASITQNWQVGPSFKESELTQTMAVATNLLLKIETEDQSHPQNLVLAGGIHSFFLQDGKVVHISGNDPRAQFELNVLKEGSFFVHASKKAQATLNGKPTPWARLKHGDRIQIGRELLVFDFCNAFDEEKTLVSILDKSFAQSFGLRGSRFSQRSFIKWGLVSLCGCLLAAVFGFLLAQNRIESNESSEGTINPPQELSRGVSDLSAPQDLLPIDQVSPTEPETPEKLSENDFLFLIEKFRNGEEKAACDEMAMRTKGQPEDNIWTKKAAFFLARRCK